MRKPLLLTVILLISAAWVLAQQSAPGSQTSPSSTTPSGSQTSPSDRMGSQGSQEPSSRSGMSNRGNETQIEGCISGSSGNYTLTDAAGTTWQLQGETSQLSKHVGQEVRINGTPSSGGVTGSSTAGSSSSATSGAGAGGAGQTFNVTKVRKISDSCKTSGMSKPSKY